LAKKLYFIAIDQGSSGTLSALFDGDFNEIDRVDIPVSRLMPATGLVEHEPRALLASITDGVAKLMEAHPECLSGLAGIGLANQGESFLLWDLTDGEPVTPVISWQDSRSEILSARLSAEGKDEWFHSKTGLHLSPEWPALKVREMREKDFELDARCRSGQITFGQLDAWFLYELSGGRVFASDHGTACRSGYYDLRLQGWSAELRETFVASDLIFPDLIENVTSIPGIDPGIGRAVRWLAGGLDQSVTLIGQRCMTAGTAKVTYGTCCACWMNLGRELVLDKKLTTSVAWKIGDNVTFALAAEGGAAGNIVTWLMENFSTEWEATALSELAQAGDVDDDLVFVPAFGGLAAPWWKKARAVLFGITQSTMPAHILRAGLDAVAFTIKDIIDVMPECERIIFDGGMTGNAYLMQKQADVLGFSILKSAEQEGTLMGIAYLCGWSLGTLPVETLPGDCRQTPVYTPDPAWDESEYDRWLRSVKTVISYYD
jgi:glycerol kinase